METDNKETGAVAPDDSRLWRMAIELDDDALRTVAQSTVDDSAVRAVTVPLDAVADSRLRAVEDAVYSSAALLGDYGSTTIVVRTAAYTQCAAELGTEAAADCAAIAGIDSDGATLMYDTVATAGLVTVWAIDTDILNFLRRTFHNCTIIHHTTPLLRYFGRRSARGNGGKTYVHFHGGTPAAADIMVFDGDGRPALIATKTVRSDSDALYYILASANACGANPRTDSIHLCGDAARRSALMPLLRRYVAQVMPVIFPAAAFRGGDAVLKAPFPLILIPLCE